MVRPLHVFMALAVALSGACGVSDDGAGPAAESASTTDLPSSERCARVPGPLPTTAPLSESDPDAAVALTQVGESVDTPTAIASLPDRDDLLVGQRAGPIRRFRASGDGFALDPEPVLDLTADVGSTEGEHGLLGLAVDPSGDWLYVDYTEATAGDIIIEAFAMVDGTPDAGTRRELLRLDPRCDAHLGGHLLIDGDGNLLIGVGDGDGGRIEHPSGSSQDRENLFGSVLRIKPTPEGDEPYAIPASNPFAGDVEGRDEILVQGVRNPWRFDLDPATGELWLADVGEDAFEELNRIPADRVEGVNLGWDHKEATRPFRNVESMPDDLFDPQYEYDRDQGCSVIGGVVVDDAAPTGIGGGFLFGDLCTGAIHLARPGPDDGIEVESLGVSIPAIVTFGRDRAGRVYGASLTGAVYRFDPSA